MFIERRSTKIHRAQRERNVLPPKNRLAHSNKGRGVYNHFAPTALITDGFEITRRSSRFAAKPAQKSNRASRSQETRSTLWQSLRCSALRRNATQQSDLA